MRHCLLILWFLIFSAADAGIYKWVDEGGKVHFGDRPPSTASSETVSLRINTIESVEVTPLTAGQQSNNEKSSRKKVVMYSTEWCGVCKKAKRYFKAKGISYKEYDVERSTKGRRDYRRLKGRGVPIILVGNQRMNGFSEGRFESIYR